LDWKRLIAIGGVVSIVVAAAVFYRPIMQGIRTTLGQPRNPQLASSTPDNPALEESQQRQPQSASDERPVGPEESFQVDTDTPASATAAQASLSPTQSPGVLADNNTTLTAGPEQNSISTEEIVLGASLTEPEPEPDGTESDTIGTTKMADYLTAMDIRASRRAALEDAMELWQTPIDVQPYLDSLDDDQAFFRLTAKPKGVFMHRIETNLEMLKRLNLPAILELFPTGSEEPGYLTLSRIEGGNYMFGNPNEDKVVVSDADQINLYWSGIAYLPWKNFLSIWGTIPKHSNKDSIITLKLLLHELGFGDVEINDEYDDWTRRAIEEVQAKYGIPVDGFVGPLTKMILYQEKESFEIPRLTN
jgi:general secretion pathway protein A